MLKDGKIYEAFNDGHFSGDRLIDITLPSRTPALAWVGGKIKADLWDQVKMFFQEHAAHEVQVRLFYNINTKEWGVWAFPQRYNTGMVTNEIADHPRRAEGFARFPSEEGWRAMGTVHHHCSGNAFQSGTDTSDEVTQEGLHITLGNMDKPTFSIHARVCYITPGALAPDGALISRSCQAFYTADLVEWFEAPEGWFGERTPAAVQGTIIKAAITERVNSKVEYPPEWKQNLIIEATRTVSTVGFGNFGGSSGNVVSGGASKSTAAQKANTDSAATFVEIQERVFNRLWADISAELVRSSKDGKSCGTIEEILVNSKHTNYAWLEEAVVRHLEKTVFTSAQWFTWAERRLDAEELALLNYASESDYPTEYYTGGRRLGEW